MFARLLAEGIGSFWLVFCGTGAAVLAAGFPEVGVGFLGIATAFGFAYVAMGFALGHICGGHFNPAVTLGLVLAGRADPREIIPYWIGQLAGAVMAAGLLYVIASGGAGFRPGGFFSNGYDLLSPGGYSLVSALLVETLLTGGFVLIILGATRPGVPAVFVPFAGGLAYAAAMMVAIPVSNGSLNPARSTASAIFAQTDAIGQLWLFWLAPLLGAALAGLLWRHVLAPGEADQRRRP